MKTSNLILLIIGILTFLFTLVMIWLYLITGGIPDTLCTMWYTYVLGECGVMGVIKSIKVISENAKAKQQEIDATKAALDKMAKEEGGKT